MGGPASSATCRGLGANSRGERHLGQAGSARLRPWRVFEAALAPSVASLRGLTPTLAGERNVRNQWYS